MKYRKGFLDWCHRYSDSNTQTTNRHQTDLGMEQFHAYESRGITPEKPDPFFTHLLDGKKWWEWTVNDYADKYLTDQWYGWYLLALDFKDDQVGFKCIRQRIAQKWRSVDVDITPDEIIAEVEREPKLQEST